MSWARGGFLGVDAFFVLSGYLITSLLLAEWRERDSIALLAFWARRARRLLPALFLMLIGVAVYALVYAQSQELARIRDDALATIGYVANWRPVFAGLSYFDRFSVPSPLRHTWSLGIEEQYYVVWPLLLLVILRVGRLSLDRLLVITVVLLASSALLMALLFRPDSDPSRVYYGTDTRAQSLLVGAALAMLLLRFGSVRDALGGRTFQIFGLLCALCVGFLWVTTAEDNVFLYRGGFLFLGIAVAVVIAAAVHSTAGPLGKVLSLPPLRALGLISYGVYLWHWPIYLVLTPGRTGWEGHGLFAVRVLATLAIATASYFLIEMPIRRGAFRRWKASWTLAPAGAVSLAVVLVLATRGGVSPAATFVGDPMPQIDNAADPALVRVIVLGDSVGLSMVSGLKQVGPEWNLAVWSRTMVGCSFLDADMEYDSQYKLSKKMAEMCNEWHKTWRGDVDAFEPDVIVVVFGGEMFDRLVNGSLLEAGTPEWEAYVLDGLQKRLELLSSEGAKLVLPTYPCSRSVLWALLSDGAEREQDAYRRTTELNQVYRKFAERNSNRVVLVDLNLFACPESRFTDLVFNGVKMREDGVHFTPAGSVVVARWLAPQIAATAQSRP